MNETESTARAPGELRPDAVYTLEEFGRRTRLGKWALSEARRNGLPVHRRHGRAFVRGDEAIAYLTGAQEGGGA